jgi:hypothetical protein
VYENKITVHLYDQGAHLLAKEVTDLHSSTSVLDDAVDGEVGVHGTHFVQETLLTCYYTLRLILQRSHLGDTGNQVLHQAAHSAKLSDVLTATLPDRKDDLGLGALLELNVHVNMANVLLEFAPWTLDGDEARLDGNGNALRNLELFGLENVLHLCDNKTLAIEIFPNTQSSRQAQRHPSSQSSPK